MSQPIPLQEVVWKLTRAEPRVVADDGADWRHAAVAAIFRDSAEGAELLYIQRAVHDRDPWSGQIAFPGGRSDPGDPSLEHTADRETREELGLPLLDSPRVRRLGALDQLQARARRKILPMAITPFAFVHDAPVRPELSLQATEVESAFWVPLHELVDPTRRILYDAHRAEAPYSFRAFDLGDQRILWGLTHFMTVEILFRLGLVEDVDSLTLPVARE